MKTDFGNGDRPPVTISDGLSWPVEPQESSPPRLLFSIWQLCGWLTVFPLVLGNPSSAHATPSTNGAWKNSLSIPMESAARKRTKAYAVGFPALTTVTLEARDRQSPTFAPSHPESSTLDEQTLETAASGVIRPTLEPLLAKQPLPPASSPEAVNPPDQLQFSDAFSLEAASWQRQSVADNPAPITNDTSPELEGLTAQTTDAADAFPWTFSVTPYFYLPFGASGDITVNGVEAPLDAGFGDIFDAIVNDLNFAAFGRVEAWNGPWGILFDGSYMNVGTGETATVNVPSEAQAQGLPPQVDFEAAVGTSFTRLDLAGGYRFGDGNSPGAIRTADTEFDLGPFVFDAYGGVRLYFFNNDLVLTNDLGSRSEFSQSRTIVEPLLGGRARWNFSPTLAAITGVSLSGFGIGDLTFSVDGYAGVDWLFSGNTSLLAAYRLTYVDYSSGNSGLNLFTHGPNIGVKFRF